MNLPHLIDFPLPISTARLSIQLRREGDGRRINAAIASSYETLSPWMPWAKTLPSIEESEVRCRKNIAEFHSKTNFVFTIYDPKEIEVLGSIGLHGPNWNIPSFQIGYWIHQKHAGKGMASEAVNALSRYAFKHLKAKRVEIRCDLRNKASVAVMNRLGFSQEGILYNNEVANDGSIQHTYISARIDATGIPPLEVSWPGDQ